MTTAFVLGGGGVLGTTQLGMLRALAEQGIRPDLVVGTSIGALNGAFVAADPSVEGIRALGTVWEDVGASGIFLENPMRSAARIARFRTHLLSSQPLRAIIDEHLPVDTFEELEVPFQCVAACIETAGSGWFSEGSLVDPVVASCTVPGLFPPVEIDGRHYLDGGLVHSIPVGRAVDLGADRIFVLQVGRVEQPLTPPRRPWEVGVVAFEIARRHRYVHEMESIPEGVEVHVLPSGAPDTPSVSLTHGRTSRLRARATQAYAATSAYLTHPNFPA
ncbi:patatin-like phospholipase family protein [Knoellia subterranea]|nr:patatin-like phospholipase family protein [Knoellia subterranea]